MKPPISHEAVIVCVGVCVCVWEREPLSRKNDHRLEGGTDKTMTFYVILYILTQILITQAQGWWNISKVKSEVRTS